MVNTNLKYIAFSHDLQACLHLNHDMHYSIQEPKSKERCRRRHCYDQNPANAAAQKVVICTWLLMHILCSTTIADAKADGYLYDLF